MKVIVNADDFGYDKNKTLAIAMAFSKGLLTTTTVMTNMPRFDCGIKIAEDQGFLSQVGLHFNLTEGRALSEEMRSCKVFCNKAGDFTARFYGEVSRRLFLSPSIQRIIAVEAEAQIRRYLDAGCTLMHLDSHHHVHSNLSIAKPLVKVAKKYRFNSIRLSRNVGYNVFTAKYLYKKVFNSYLKSQIPSTTNHFTDLEDFKKYLNNIRPTSWVEIMVHPHFSEKAFQTDDAWSPQSAILFDEGRNMAADWEFWKAIEPLGILRCNYSPLKKSRST